MLREFTRGWAHKQKARQVLAPGETTRGQWLSVAAVYAALGARDEAFRLLFKGVAERDGLNYVRTDPASTPCIRIGDGQCSFSVCTCPGNAANQGMASWGSIPSVRSRSAQWLPQERR